MTFADAARLHMQRLDENVRIKRRTRICWREIPAALLKSWPALAETEIRRVLEVENRNLKKLMAEPVCRALAPTGLVAPRIDFYRQPEWSDGFERNLMIKAI